MGMNVDASMPGVLFWPLSLALISLVIMEQWKLNWDPTDGGPYQSQEVCI